MNIDLNQIRHIASRFSVSESGTNKWISKYLSELADQVDELIEENLALRDKLSKTNLLNSEHG